MILNIKCKTIVSAADDLLNYFLIVDQPATNQYSHKYKEDALIGFLYLQVQGQKYLVIQYTFSHEDAKKLCKIVYFEKVTVWQRTISNWKRIKSSKR